MPPDFLSDESFQAEFTVDLLHLTEPLDMSRKLPPLHPLPAQPTVNLNPLALSLMPVHLPPVLNPVAT